MMRMAYTQGMKAAFAKFALVMPSMKPITEHALELAGLGLIAAPVAHSIIAGDENESPAVNKLKHTSDLAGLGLLAVPTAMKLLQRH
jgi:hypothetical protein